MAIGVIVENINAMMFTLKEKKISGHRHTNFMAIGVIVENINAMMFTLKKKKISGHRHTNDSD